MFKDLILMQSSPIDPALWMHGGTLGTSRYLSRFIALQIKASLMGTPLVPYEKKFAVDGKP